MRGPNDPLTWRPGPLTKRGRLLERLVPDLVRSKTRDLAATVGELGVDPFGFDPEAVKHVAGPILWLYRSYFRAITKGIEKVPNGRVLLVSNHSGQLPFDGVMIAAAMMFDRDPPRVIRTMVEKWVPRLPFVSVFFARVGQVVGTPDNCRRLLARQETILVFPEGVRGLSKTFDRRYQLERFGSGFMRLALETSTPIVPIAVIGAEEQSPSLFNLKRLGRAFGMPAFPVTPTFPLLGPIGLLPYPTRYRIYFGDPMAFEGRGDEEDDLVETYVAEVRTRVQTMVNEGLAERDGIFR